jgi:hypothetical protein
MEEVVDNMITFKQSGNFNNTEAFFKKVTSSNYAYILEKYGREGVDALSNATPVDSGKTASSWNYEINISKKRAKITWTNSNVVDNVPIAIILQYGHVTKNGGYVDGRDYINPALRPIFDEIAKELWKEVSK